MTFALVIAVVVSSFLGHYVVTIAGYNLRWEQAVPLFFVGWLIAYARTRADFLRALTHPVVLVFGVFVAWNVVATLVFSPSLGKSASILVWFVIDLLLLAGIISLGARAKWFENAGIRAVVPWGLAGFAAFIVANASHGGFTPGTDFDGMYQVYVARLTSQEANIYASILVLWTLLLVARKGRDRVWMVIAAVAVPLGVIGSQTRTAVFCLAAGLIVYLVYEAKRSFQARQRRTGFWFGPVVLVVGIAVAYGVATILPAFGEDVARAEPSATSPSEPAATPEPSGKLGDIDFEGGNIGFRIEVAKAAAEDMSGANLWLGNGTNTFSLRHDQPGSPGVPGHIIMLPVQILYDVGIVGLLLLVGLVVTVLRHVPWQRRPIAWAVVVAFSAAATLTSMFWFSITWIVVALLIRPVMDGEGTPEDGGSPTDRSTDSSTTYSSLKGL
ncbi:O-antigen ligase family protein [Rhodococcus opacus]|uniref:O-antigen ligase family protein n=1 Tax=Rhodococcus opacus TaxID=37919 RepID=UPI0005C219A2|nr:O-antigen ligase family protein [Rhodococcus opacus]